MSTLKTANATAKAAFNAARADLDELRRLVETKKAERQAVEHQPADAETNTAIIQASIAGAVQVHGITPYMFSNVEGLSKGHVIRAFGAAVNSSGGLLALLAQMFPERVEELLIEHLPQNGVAPAARAASLAQLDSDILAAEIAEEAACREIEAAMGVKIPRRYDANPAVLLAR